MNEKQIQVLLQVGRINSAQAEILRRSIVSEIIPNKDSTKLNIPTAPPVAQEKPQALDINNSLLTEQGSAKPIAIPTMEAPPAEATAVLRPDMPIKAPQFPPKAPTPKIGSDYNFQTPIQKPSATLEIKPPVMQSDVPSALATGQSIVKESDVIGENKAQRIEAGITSPLEQIATILLSTEDVAGFYRTGSLPVVSALGLPSRVAGAVLGQGDVTSNETSALKYPREKLREYIASTFKDETRESLLKSLNDKLIEVSNNYDLSEDTRQNSMDLLKAGIKDLEYPMSTRHSKTVALVLSDLLTGAIDDPAVLATLGAVSAVKLAKADMLQRAGVFRKQSSKIEEKLLSKGIDKTVLDHIQKQPQDVIHPLTGDRLTAIDFFNEKAKVNFRQPAIGGNIKLHENVGDPLLRQIVKPEPAVPINGAHTIKGIKEFDEMATFESQLEKINVNEELRKRSALRGPLSSEDIPNLEELEDAKAWLLKELPPDIGAREYAEHVASLIDEIKKGILSGPQLRKKIEDLNAISNYGKRFSSLGDAQKAVINLGNNLRDIIDDKVFELFTPKAYAEYKAFSSVAKAKYSRMRDLQGEVLGGYFKNPKNLTEQDLIDARRRLNKYIEGVGKDWASGNTDAMEALQRIDKDFGTNMSDIAKDYGAADRGGLYNGIDLKSGKKIDPEQTRIQNATDEIMDRRNLYSKKSAMVGLGNAVKALFKSIPKDDRMDLINKLRKYDKEIAKSLFLEKELDKFDSFKKMMEYIDQVIFESGAGMEKGKIRSMGAPALTSDRMRKLNKTLINFQRSLKQLSAKYFPESIRKADPIKIQYGYDLMQKTVGQAVQNQKMDNQPDEETNPDLIPAE